MKKGRMKEKDDNKREKRGANDSAIIQGVYRERASPALLNTYEVKLCSSISARRRRWLQVSNYRSYEPSVDPFSTAGLMLYTISRAHGHASYTFSYNILVPLYMLYIPSHLVCAK